MTHYRCIQMDPPWEERGGGGRGAQNHYDLMSVEAIWRTVVSAPVWRPHPNGCHLWCWYTDNFLLDALSLVDRLGFRYVRQAVWPKASWGMGQYLRGQHENVLLAVMGSLAPLPTAASTSSVIVERNPAARRKHSRKPVEAYEMIERVSPGPRLEMFAQVARDGWDRWGAQAPAEAEA